MRFSGWVILSFLLLLTDKSTAEKDWGQFDKKIADKMKSKNNFYKEKENKIKSQLSNRIKNIIQNESQSSKLRSRIYRYIDRKGNSTFSDRVRHKGYKEVKLRATPRRKIEVISGSFYEKRKLYGTVVKRAAQAHRIPASLLHAIISAESGYNPEAVSRAGAVGLMQLMPATASRYDVKDRKDPIDSIRGGARYFRYLLDLFDNDIRLALAAYNAGENAVIKYGRRIPPYRETQNYVKRVLKFYEEYSGVRRKF